jgi:hypothetical protein
MENSLMSMLFNVCRSKRYGSCGDSGLKAKAVVVGKDRCFTVKMGKGGIALTTKREYIGQGEY